MLLINLVFKRIDSPVGPYEPQRRRQMASTCISRHMNAPRARVYKSLIDAGAIAKWKVPTGMTCQVHEFEGREGGAFRISLTYDEQTGTGKTTAQTDTYRGRFVTLVPNERVVEVDEFETANPALRGEMTIAPKVGRSWRPRRFGFGRRRGRGARENRSATSS